MVFKKLKQGMEFKSYKALCEFLGIKVKTGKARQLFMEELGRYVEYHKVGNKIIIDEVLNVPIAKVDKRKDKNKRSNNAMYSNDIQALIISLLAGADGNTVFLPVNLMLRVLDMVNCNYAEAKRNVPKLAELTLVPETYCYDFFNTNNVQLKNKLETALKGLKRRSLVFSQECISVCVLEADVEFTALGDIKVNPVNKKEGSISYVKKHREATKEEEKLILHTGFITLEEMGYTSQQQVFFSGRWAEYQKRVNKKLFELANIEYYYDSYRLTYNSDDISKVHLIQLKQEEKEAIKSNLNKNINKMIKSYANTNHKRAKSKKLDEIQSSDTYVGYMETLSDIVIKKGAKDIRAELKKPLKKPEQVTFENMPF